MTTSVEQQQGQEAERSTVPDRIRLGIPLALAVVVGIFVALGIEGDVRARIIRNAPGWVSAAFALTMVGLALPLFDVATDSGRRDSIRRERKRRRILGTVGGLVILAGALVAVVIGSTGLSEREHPILAVSSTLADQADGVVQVHVASEAPTLRSNEKMLVRVAAIREGAASEMESLCAVAHLPSPNWPPKDVLERIPRVRDPVRLLYWGETGPNTKGSASTKVAVQIARSEFSHVCVYAGLVNRRGQGPTGSRLVWAQTDLSAATPVP